jgi:hypothetical protein
MNTLPPEIRARLFRDRAHAAELRRRWATLTRQPRQQPLTAAHHLLYATLCGRDWRRGFTPVHSERKLASGGYFNWGLHHALAHLRSSTYDDVLLQPFDGLVMAEMLRLVRELLSPITLYRLDPHAVAARGLPFDAYPEQEVPRA